MSDVYRILSIISSKQDYTDTSDKRSKTKRHSMERLSRVFGFDYSEEKMKTLIKQQIIKRFFKLAAVYIFVSTVIKQLKLSHI